MKEATPQVLNIGQFISNQVYYKRTARNKKTAADKSHIVCQRRIINSPYTLRAKPSPTSHHSVGLAIRQLSRKPY